VLTRVFFMKDVYFQGTYVRVDKRASTRERSSGNPPLHGHFEYTLSIMVTSVKITAVARKIISITSLWNSRSESDRQNI